MCLTNMGRTGLTIAVSILTIGGTVLLATSGSSRKEVITGSDVELIRAVVDGAVQERFTACLYDSFTNLDVHKQNMAQFYSSSAPTGDALATRASQWKSDWSTPSADELDTLMDNRVQMVNEGELPITMLDNLLTPPAVTPDWYPETSPLVHQQAALDRCHAGRAEDRLGREVGFDVEVVFDDIVITGNTAVVSATLTGSTERMYPSSSETQTVPVDWKATYWMINENNQWHIKGEELYVAAGRGVG